MNFTPSEPRPYFRHGKRQPGRWEIDLRGTLDNGLVVKRQRRVFPLNPAVGKIGKRQAAAMAREEWQRWNRHGQVLRPGETPVLERTGAMRPGHAPTFAQFAPDFLDFCASPTASPRGANSAASIDNKESSLRLHLLPMLGSLRMDQLTRRHVDQFVTAKIKAGRSEASIRLDLSTLRRMLHVALEYELIDKVPNFRTPPVPKSDVVALTPDETMRFREVSRERHARQQAVLLELFLRTGLRCGEALALYPEDLHLDAQQPIVRVRRTWTKRHKYRPPKSGVSRVVPLVPALAAELDALVSELGFSSKCTTNHIFSAKESTTVPFLHRTVLRLVRRTGEAAETQPVHTHMLRHTFGTECARRGVPLLTIKEWMGHADIKMTMRYLHLVAPDHLRYAELLDE